MTGKCPSFDSQMFAFFTYVKISFGYTIDIHVKNLSIFWSESTYKFYTILLRAVVVSFHCSSDWPPCHARNRHLFLSTRSHQSECQLAWINIINPSHAITVSTCQVFIIWIESCAKYSCIRITESNSMCYFAEGILRLRDLRFGRRLLRVYVFSMSIKHVDTLLICLAWSWVVMHLIGIQKYTD